MAGRHVFQHDGDFMPQIPVGFDGNAEEIMPLVQYQPHEDVLLGGPLARLQYFVKDTAFLHLPHQHKVITRLGLNTSLLREYDPGSKCQIIYRAIPFSTLFFYVRKPVLLPHRIFL